MIRKLAFHFLMSPGINELFGYLYKALRNLGLLKSKFIYPYRGTIRIRINEQIKFKMFSNGGDTIATRIYQDGVGAFEPEMGPVFKKLIERAGVFLDIGANTGFYSLMADQISRNCIVHAFEPVPSIFETLKQNINLNNCRKVTPHLLALSNETKTSSFFVPKSIRISTGASQIAHFEDSDEISCQLIRLDDFVKIHNLQNVDFLKIDTESTEPLVLEGGLQTISMFRPYIILEILNNNVAAQIENLIAPLNYRYFQIVPGKLNPISSLELGVSRDTNWNFLLVPQEKAYNTFLES